MTSGLEKDISSKGGMGSRNVQSSPGYLHVGHVPSKCTWQIPQTSSSGMSHRQVATAFHFLILTFMATTAKRELYSRKPLEYAGSYFVAVMQTRFGMKILGLFITWSRVNFSALL
jgi:hypothetical protein